MILITGATGLVGSHLLLHLLTNNPNLAVKALYQSATKQQQIVAWLQYKNNTINVDNVQWIQANILDIPALEAAFANVNYVYHCAAIVDFDPKQKDKLNKVNIEGTANVVNLALYYNIKKLCYVSSIATLGDPKPGETIDEQCEWNPDQYNGDYAISKNGGETEVWRAMYEGLPAVIVNPGVILGDGLWQGGSAEIFNQVNKGFPFYTKGTTGFVAVTDVVTCMVALLNSDIEKERFILVESSPSFQEILNNIAQAIHKKKPTIYATKFMTNIAWRADALVSLLTGKKRTLTKDAANASHSISTYNASKVKETLNYQFTPIKKYIQSIGTEYVTYSNK
ncbi:NAD-dependent epimerase/dehydratase family protein [Flavobacterium agricola]|uniref:NAD-dependent epimerase/dehydratase family protein n=1 Tax=Flavobacterium agricola TaxID=2870839 RepID=A0ABY6LY63_9FLAO|nr:NAD-dependent epimerase/dehydratase family protein [Flavobacterium agricola]UYW01280.1 NAD-dependent epimerase/dehydratase family protein [Flavobacterium agricola]